MIRKQNLERGFSIIELLVVLVVMSILTGFTAYYFASHQKLYKADDQALKIIDILQEARQRALTQRESIRVEINATKNTARIIDENDPLIIGDDAVIRQITLFIQTDVKFATRASNITYNPPEPIVPASAVFTPSVYPSSTTQSVCTLRFQSNGTVLNAGNDGIGNGSTPTSSTLHIWSLKAGTSNDADIARSITISAASGSMRMWEFDKTSTDANKWQDSRRTSVF